MFVLTFTNRNDPAAIALMCQRAMEAIVLVLFGVPTVLKKTVVDFESRPTGAFGHANAYFTVSEVTGRDQLHWHTLLWCGIPHWATQRCAGATNLQR